MSNSVVLSCPACATRFGAPASQFVPDGRQVRCSQCKHVWFHALPDDEPASAPAPAPTIAVAPVRPPAPAKEEAEAVPEPHRAAEEHPASSEPEAERMTGRRGGWLGPLLWALALLLLVAILAYAFRDPLRAAVPGVAPWVDRYAGAVDRTARRLTGRDGGNGTLQFRGVHYDLKEYDMGEEMLVEADLFNTGPDDMPAPRVRVRVVDAARASLHVSVVGPEDLSETIPAGGGVRYFVRIPEPPAGFASVLVDIAGRE